MKNYSTKKEILERISFFRTQRNMSAYKLGQELGHSKTYFYRIESGEIQLTIEMFLDILDILQVSTTEFFCTNHNKENLEILDNINNLNSANKQTIIDLIKKLQ